MSLIGVIYVTRTRVDKVIIEPGTAESVDGKIEFNDVQTYDSNGEIRFLTVYVSSKKPSLAAYWVAKYLKHDSQILPWDEVNGDFTEKESNELNEALMEASQNSASVVALNQIGCDVEQEGTGAIISAVEKNSPASKDLRKGDVIVLVDSKEVKTDEQAADSIVAHKPGDEIVVTVERGEDHQRKTFKATLQESPYREGAAYLGVGLVTRDQKFDFPVDFDIDPGAVSGPSAGLAFTLSIIDQLTAGDLTGGKNVAVTGEISLDGDVGPVGGVEQKAITANRAQSNFMIVPKGEGKLARKTAGSMKVYEVSSVDDALEVLKENGGDPLAQMQSCPTS